MNKYYVMLKNGIDVVEVECEGRVVLNADGTVVFTAKNEELIFGAAAGEWAQIRRVK